MAKVLKKKKKVKRKILKKKVKKKILKKKKVHKKKRIKKPKIKKPKKPVGRWCAERDGVLPFPIECHYLQRLNRSCGKCKRTIEYRKWRAGAYIRIEDDIDRGIDFTDPDNVPVFVDVVLNDWAKKPGKKTTKRKRIKKNKKT